MIAFYYLIWYGLSCYITYEYIGETPAAKGFLYVPWLPVSYAMFLVEDFISREVSETLGILFAIFFLGFGLMGLAASMANPYIVATFMGNVLTISLHEELFGGKNRGVK